MAEPEIKTMKKDIEEMKKKIRTSASIDEPITKIGEPVPSARLAIKQVSEPPNNLPMVPSLPGASLPSEPIFSEKPFEPVESIKQLEQVPTSLGQKPEIERPSRRKTPFKKMVLIVLVVLMLSGAGFYYWKYLRNPEIETPASFISIESTKEVALYSRGHSRQAILILMSICFMPVFM